MPCELHRGGERLEIGDGPLVVVGAAGADEVAQQVQVEADKDQDRRESRMRGQSANWRLWSSNGRAESEVRKRACGGWGGGEWMGGGQRADPGQRPRDDIGGKGTHQGKCQRMQRMMVLGKPQQRMRCVTG